MCTSLRDSFQEEIIEFKQAPQRVDIYFPKRTTDRNVKRGRFAVMHKTVRRVAMLELRHARRYLKNFLDYQIQDISLQTRNP